MPLPGGVSCADLLASGLAAADTGTPVSSGPRRQADLVGQTACAPCGRATCSSSGSSTAWAATSPISSTPCRTCPPARLVRRTRTRGSSCRCRSGRSGADCDARRSRRGRRGVRTCCRLSRRGWVKSTASSIAGWRSLAARSRRWSLRCSRAVHSASTRRPKRSSKPRAAGPVGLELVLARVGQVRGGRSACARPRSMAVRRPSTCRVPAGRRVRRRRSRGRGCPRAAGPATGSRRSSRRGRSRSACRKRSFWDMRRPPAPVGRRALPGQPGVPGSIRSRSCPAGVVTPCKVGSPRRGAQPDLRVRWKSARHASDYDTLDLVDGHRIRRPVVELSRLRRRVPGDLLSVFKGPPPFDRYAVIPVARNVWQHVEGGSLAAVARRLIIARTTRRCSARPVSQRPAGSTLWKSVAFGSASSAASTYLSSASAARWWAGTSCLFRPSRGA